MTVGSASKFHAIALGLIGLVGDWLGAAATVLVLVLQSLLAAAYIPPFTRGGDPT